METLRNYRAELESVRDMIVGGDALMVYKMMTNLSKEEIAFSCVQLEQVLISSSAYTNLTKLMEKEMDPSTLEYTINEKIRPNITTLSTINKMMEKVEHVLAVREKIEMSLMFSFFSVFYAMLCIWLEKKWEEWLLDGSQ